MSLHNDHPYAPGVVFFVCADRRGVLLVEKGELDVARLIVHYLSRDGDVNSDSSVDWLVGPSVGWSVG